MAGPGGRPGAFGLASIVYTGRWIGSWSPRSSRTRESQKGSTGFVAQPTASLGDCCSWYLYRVAVVLGHRGERGGQPEFGAANYHLISEFDWGSTPS